MKFVVQEHFATHHHFDFRLEMNGVAKSWTVPKGLPTKKGEKKLAIQVNDHDIDYMEFEGEIKEGYGAGKVYIYDKGEYELIRRDKDEIKINLKGKKFKGIFVLIRFPKAGKDAWLIIKT